jgi:hypothetical protein
MDDPHSSNPTSVWIPKEMKLASQRHISLVFTTVFFTVAELWKQILHPLAEEWIRKV